MLNGDDSRKSDVSTVSLGIKELRGCSDIYIAPAARAGVFWGSGGSDPSGREQ